MLIIFRNHAHDTPLIMSMFFFVKMLMSFEQDAHEVFEMLEVIAILTCGTVIACVVGLPPLRLAAIGRLLSQGVFFSDSSGIIAIFAARNSSEDCVILQSKTNNTPIYDA